MNVYIYLGMQEKYGLLVVGRERTSKNQTKEKEAKERAAIR